MAGSIFFQDIMSSNRDVRSAESVMEPKLLSRSSKRHRVGDAKAPSSGTQQSKDIITTVDSDEEVIPDTQPSTPPLNTIPSGNAHDEGHRDASKKRRVLQTLCDRIDAIQQSDKIITTSDEIFTVPLCSTPNFNEAYNEAADGIVSDDGLAGPSAIGVISSEEKSIQEALDNLQALAEKIVSAWGFNFNDTHYEKKRNLYHLIYTGDHVDYLHMDLNSPSV